jgi:hypothetical protein
MGFSFISLVQIKVGGILLVKYVRLSMFLISTLPTELDFIKCMTGERNIRESCWVHFLCSKNNPLEGKKYILSNLMTT